MGITFMSIGFAMDIHRFLFFRWWLRRPQRVGPAEVRLHRPALEEARRAPLRGDEGERTQGPRAAFQGLRADQEARPEPRSRPLLAGTIQTEEGGRRAASTLLDVGSQKEKGRPPDGNEIGPITRRAKMDLRRTANIKIRIEAVVHFFDSRFSTKKNAIKYPFI